MRAESRRRREDRSRSTNTAQATCSRRESPKPRLRRQATSGQDRRKSQDGRQATGHEVSSMARERRRIARGLIGLHHDQWLDREQNRRRRKHREPAGRLCVCSFITRDPVCNVELERILDRPVGRDPVDHPLCDVVSQLRGRPCVGRRRRSPGRCRSRTSHHSSDGRSPAGIVNDLYDFIVADPVHRSSPCPHQDGLFLHELTPE